MNPYSTNCDQKWGFLVLRSHCLDRLIANGDWRMHWHKRAAETVMAVSLIFDRNKFAYQGNIQRIATALQYLAFLSLIGFIGYAGWFWTELSAINKEIASLEEDLVSQIKETMPDLPASVMSNPSTVVSLMQEEITVATDKLDKLGSSLPMSLQH